MSKIMPVSRPISVIRRVSGGQRPDVDDATLFQQGQLDRYYDPDEQAIIERFPAINPLPPLKALLKRLLANGEPLDAISYPQLKPVHVYQRALKPKTA